MAGNILGSRSARKAGQAAANIRAGQAGENAALARELPYRLNPYLQQGAEQWSGNVRGVYDEAGNLVMDTAGGAAAGARGAAQQGNQYLDPYLTQGQGANTTLSDWAAQKLNAPAAQFEFSENDPSYQWRLQQGQKALERSAAGRGGLQSGATLKALTNYSQNAASQEYAAEHARWLKEQELANRTQELGATSLSNLAQRGLLAGTEMGRNLLTGEKYAGDWLTQGADAAGRLRGRGAEYQSNTMYGSLQDQIRNIFAGEGQGMNYMTDRADALAGGNIASGQAQANMWAGLGNAAGQGLNLWGMMQQQKEGAGGSGGGGYWGSGGYQGPAEVIPGGDWNKYLGSIFGF